jgi:hypothetical protein
MRWARFLNSNAGTLSSAVEVDISGIPAHAWDLTTAEVLLCDHCWISRVHPDSADRRDVFKVVAWCSSPDLIPPMMDLEIVEPPLVEEVPPVKRTLVYSVKLAITPIDLQTGSTATPPPPPVDDERRRHWRRRRSSPPRAPGSRDAPRVLVHDRLGPRPAADCHVEPQDSAALPSVLPLQCASASPGGIEDMAAVPSPDASYPATALGDEDGGTSPFCVASARNGGSPSQAACGRVREALAESRAVIEVAPLVDGGSVVVNEVDEGVLGEDVTPAGPMHLLEEEALAPVGPPVFEDCGLFVGAVPVGEHVEDIRASSGPTTVVPKVGAVEDGPINMTTQANSGPSIPAPGMVETSIWSPTLEKMWSHTALSTERRTHRQLVAAPSPLVPSFPRVYSRRRKSLEPLPRDMRAGLGLEQSALTPPSKHFSFMSKIAKETSWILPTPRPNRTRQRSRTPGAPRRSRRIAGVEP